MNACLQSGRLLSAPSVCGNSKANCYCEALTFSNLIMTKRSGTVEREQLSPSVGVGNISVKRSIPKESKAQRGVGEGVCGPAFQSKTLPHANSSALKRFQGAMKRKITCNIFSPCFAPYRQVFLLISRNDNNSLCALNTKINQYFL